MRCPTLSELPPPPPGKTGWPWTEESPQLPDTMPDGSPWPRVSIVTPSYNQGRFLEETMRSVLLQGYPNLEYIIMDGGSTDNSVKIIQSYALHLTCWHSQKDKGQADGISRGLNLSNGEILGWVNSDDMLLPGCLHEVGRYFVEYPEIDCAVGGSIIIDGSGRVVRDRLGLPKVVRGERETFKSLLLRGGLSFYQAASFWRREAYLAAGGLDISLVFAMDYDFYLRLARIKPFGHLDELLACFRVHPESKTTLLQSVHYAEREKLWKRYGRDSMAPAYRVLYKAYMAVAGRAKNLPVRMGVATGLVTLPYGKG